MKIPQEILGKEPAKVQELFTYWDDIMEKKVEFWPLEGEFDVHTKGHCERVLLLALKIAHLRRLTDRQTEALCHASIFHDSRRKDNYMDTGHGERAANYYRTDCEKLGLKYLPEAYAAIFYHDLDDRKGEEYIKEWAPRYVTDINDRGTELINNWTEVYHDFKDADALDRLRLGPWALDEKYLRTAESKSLISFAQELVNNTMDPAEYKKIMDATRPFADKFSHNKSTNSTKTRDND